MFGGKKNKDNMFASGGTTLLARSVEVVGDIKFSGNLEVEGVVTGNIYAQSESDARVRIMEKGKVSGEINAPKIIINGHVTGDVYSSKHIELAANAVVNGNVHYSVIEMVKGAEVNGNLVHLVDGEASHVPPEPELIPAHEPAVAGLTAVSKSSNT